MNPTIQTALLFLKKDMNDVHIAFVEERVRNLQVCITLCHEFIILLFFLNILFISK